MLFIFLYLLWLIINARLTVEVILLGFPVVILVYAFSLRCLDYSLRRDLGLLRRIPALLFFLGTLLKNVVLSSLRVMKLIWSRRSPEPKLVTFTPRLKTKAGRVMLSDAITLTPGTVTADLSGDTLTVHVLEGQRSSSLPGSPEELRIRVLEEKGAGRHG